MTHCSSKEFLILTILVVALSVSKSVVSQEFHIVLILFILVFTVLFCHSLVRVGMLVLRPRRRERATRPPLATDPRGFAHPPHPIRVNMAIDEELGFDDSNVDTEKELAAPPPVYGLWRGSVVSTSPFVKE